MGDMSFGLNITLIGMSLVFALLALLWLVLTLIGRLDSLSFMQPAEDAADEPEQDAVPLCLETKHADEIEPELMAAITLAIAAHISTRRKQGAPSMRMNAPGSQIFASRWMAAGRTRQTGGWTPKG